MSHSKGRPGGTDQGQSVVYGVSEHYYLYDREGNRHEGKIGDSFWSQWLEDSDNRSISFMNNSINRSSLITLRRYKVRRQGKEIGEIYYWYAFKKQDKKLYKVYVGKELTLGKMKEALDSLQEKIAGS